MIVGLGVDLVEVARIRDVHERFGERFARRILTPEEMKRYAAGEPISTLAKHFCAKEAAGKALGTGVMGPIGFKHIVVAHRPSGKPYLKLEGPARERLEKIGGRMTHLSISDEKNLTVAVVVIEGGVSDGRSEPSS